LVDPSEVGTSVAIPVNTNNSLIAFVGAKIGSYKLDLLTHLEFQNRRLGGDYGLPYSAYIAHHTRPGCQLGSRKSYRNLEGDLA
jgi:hypothetical protein